LRCRLPPGDERIRRSYEDKFRKAVAAKYADIRGRKLAEASAAVNDMLLQASSQLSGVAARPGATLADVNAQLQAFLERFSASAAGPTKWLKLAEFLKGGRGGEGGAGGVGGGGALL
jgi:hypothetical protein